jgi:hypothetical protein
MKRELTKIWEERGHEGIKRTVEIATGKLSVVSISLRDPLVAPKIFERLNNRAELVTAADLVRNEVFSRASDDPTRAAHVFSNQWEPFANHFAGMESGLEKFLFPYGLILKPSITKADLFSSIRTHWTDLQTPDEIIADMQKYVGGFLSLETGSQDITLPPELQACLDRVHRLGKPSSTYAFIMRLVLAVKGREVETVVAVKVLDVIECFLFRRAICGIEPTGLHAVFKGLWSDLTEDEDENEDVSKITPDAVHAAISARPTVDWPSDAEFESAIKEGDLYNRKVVKYALREFEVSREGETPEDDFQIEHIVPQTSTEHWLQVFDGRYEELVNTWANLVPITGRMNVQAGQEPYETKREEYSNSIFATTREIAEDYVSWSPVEVEERAAKIVKWAKTRWPYQRK